jgi:GDP/UDP-N,N'-diacetylbacillosamine 2-epimerase (hydrolysing)
MQEEKSLNFYIIAFGTHLKKQNGATINEIKSDGFKVDYQIDNLIPGDEAINIVESYANTVRLFGLFWNENHTKFDLVLSLGDRFEMAAAVNAGIPFNVVFGHIHAGETSEGAIDNVYRDQITSASSHHFISAPQFKSRVEGIVNKKGTTTLTGAIGLENIKALPLLNETEFKAKWNIDLNLPSVLITVHPETINYKENHQYVAELEKVLKALSSKYQLVITMTNADTLGTLYRKMYQKMALNTKNVCLIENFGSQSYFSAMKMARILLGNSSSGIVEAASFNKYVVNIGNRQKNRLCSKNVIHVPFRHKEIINATEKHINLKYDGENIYSFPEGITSLVEKLKSFSESKRK